jgi:DNA-binding transcriptional LysR family regulator
MGAEVTAVSAEALRDFAVFARQLNFTRAARELHISQPALHVKARRLAEHLGRPLYRREGRRLVLTPAGEAAGRRGREIEHEVRGLVDELSATLAPPVVLAAGEGAHLHVLGPAVQGMLAAGVRLRLLNTDADRAVDAVRMGDADIAVVVVEAVPRSLAGDALASYPQVAAVPVGHRLARQRSVALRDLDGEALVVPPPGRPLRNVLERALRAAPARWTVAVEAEGWPAMQRFVALGLGVAVVNGCVEPAPGVVHRPIVDLPEVTYTALHRRGARDRADVTALLAALHAGAP